MAIAYWMKIWDVIVIGAGPAGATIARLLAQDSHTVLLVDKAEFPRNKVCGCCISDTANGAIGRSGLPGLLPALGGVELSQRIIYEGQKVVRTPLTSSFSLSRSKLDEALTDAGLLRGVGLLANAIARVLGSDGQSRSVNVRKADHNNDVRAKLVIVADGIAGTSLDALPEFVVRVEGESKLGLGAVLSYVEDFYEIGKVYTVRSTDGYVEIVRVEDDKLNVSAVLNSVPAGSESLPATAAVGILQGAGLPIPDNFLNAQWSEMRISNGKRSAVSAERVLVLGDACGYSNSLEGEGISKAINAAIEVVPIAKQAIANWGPHLAEQWRMKYLQIMSDGKK